MTKIRKIMGKNMHRRMNIRKLVIIILMIVNLIANKNEKEIEVEGVEVLEEGEDLEEIEAITEEVLLEQHERLISN